MSETTQRLKDLCKLKDGWYDGQEGGAYKWSDISVLVLFMEVNNSNNHPVYVYPVPSGGVLLEWSFVSSECSLEVHTAEWTAEWFELKADDSFVEKDLVLYERADIDFFKSRIAALVAQEALNVPGV